MRTTFFPCPGDTVVNAKRRTAWRDRPVEYIIYRWVAGMSYEIRVSPDAGRTRQQVAHAIRHARRVLRRSIAGDLAAVVTP